MSNLLLLTTKMDIGINGISITFSAVDDDLAKLLEQIDSFKVESVSRHALGTSDVKLLSSKGLGFIERPQLDNTPDETVSEDCGCDSLDKPLIPVEVPKSEFSLRLMTEEEYGNGVGVLPIPTPVKYSDLGNLTIKSVDGKWSMEGTVKEISGQGVTVDKAYALLCVEVSDYIRSWLGVMSVENPDKPVLTVSSYATVKNYTASQVYKALEGNFAHMFLSLGITVSGITVPNVSIIADWDGSGSNKFAKNIVEIDMSKVSVLKDTGGPVLP